jgi:hypothetical protein
MLDVENRKRLGQRSPGFAASSLGEDTQGYRAEFLDLNKPNTEPERG